VAVVIEYLNRAQSNRLVPKAGQGDERLELLDEDEWDDEPGDV